MLTFYCFLFPMKQNGLRDRYDPESRLAARAAAPRAGCLEGSIFLSARVRIVNSETGMFAQKR